MPRRCLNIFTCDLRVNSNPCLSHAANNFEYVYPIFILDEKFFTKITISNNRRAYLYECLQDLKNSLINLGSDLIVKKGNWQDEVIQFIKDNDIDFVTWAKDVSGVSKQRDEKLIKSLNSLDVRYQQFDSHFVIPPGTITPSNKDGEYKVFTPFYNKWKELPLNPIGRSIKTLPTLNKYYKLSAEDGLPKLTKKQELTCSISRQTGGETLIRKQLNIWVKKSLAIYDDNRNDLNFETSKLGSALHFGTISAQEIALKLKNKQGSEPFLRQLCWRDFYAQIIFYNPHAVNENYLKKSFNWNDDEEAFTKWCNGQTGYPVVDAAMIQLMQEGFMHNRARMIVASFLTKDLFIDWRKGAWWFSQWLTDADDVNNNMSWQWVAGTGTDTNPHRIFNPIRQSEKFDPNGKYIRKYLPALKEVPDKYIHFPFDYQTNLFDAQVQYDYPAPIVDHKEAIEIYKNQLTNAPAEVTKY